MAKGRLRRRLEAIDENLTSRPDAALVDILDIPEPFVSPGQRIFRRIVYATLALFAAVLIVYLDRDGYRDVDDGITRSGLSFLDCLYYATVSLSTTGYGDITPITPSARLINVLVITPLRIAFLIVLIGTTVETLTTQSRQAFEDPAMEEQRAQPHRRRRIRHQGQDGGRRDGRRRGAHRPTSSSSTRTPTALERANSAGLVTVHGDATKSEVLRLASAQHAKSIIVATNATPRAVLVTLTARELAPNAKIIAAVREAENQHLLRQSGADSTVVSSETAGRLLGIATADPERCRDDGRPADPRRRVRDRRTRGRAQRGRRFAAAPDRHRAGRRSRRQTGARRRTRGRRP